MKRYLNLTLWLFLYTVVAYHLTEYDNFPLSDNYQFPLENILVAFMFGLVLVMVIEWQFQRVFNKPDFQRKKAYRFLFNTLLILSAIFVLTYWIISGGRWNIYYIIISYFLTLVNSIVWIAFVYGKVIFLSWRKDANEQSITIKSGKMVHRINYEDLSHFTSTRKIVIAYLKSGRSIVTSFNLTELQGLLPENFFRINRQYILNKEAIDRVSRLANQTMEVHLKDFPLEDSLVVSRYRVSNFRKWFF